MKLKLAIFSLLFFIIANAQTDSTSQSSSESRAKPIFCGPPPEPINRAQGVMTNRVAEMAIYPGCEEFKGDKRNLVRCFERKLGSDIEKHTKLKFPKNVYKKYIGVRVEFKIRTNGEITDINPKWGDVEFRSEAKRAIEKVAERLKENKQKIIPAKYDDGDDAILIFNYKVKLDNPDYNYVYDIVSSYRKEKRSINEILDTLNSGNTKKYSEKEVKGIIEKLNLK